jgi:hypothetical protein
MKVGDIVQVRQHQHLADRPVADPPIEAGAIDTWVYAKVLALADDGAQVRISHPGNSQHGQELHVVSADLRVKADVEKLRDAVKQANPQYAAQMKAHYQAQADRLS